MPRLPDADVLVGYVARFMPPDRRDRIAREGKDKVVMKVARSPDQRVAFLPEGTAEFLRHFGFFASDREAVRQAHPVVMHDVLRGSALQDVEGKHAHRHAVVLERADHAKGGIGDILLLKRAIQFRFANRADRAKVVGDVLQDGKREGIIDEARALVTLVRADDGDRLRAPKGNARALARRTTAEKKHREKKRDRYCVSYA